MKKKWPALVMMFILSGFISLTGCLEQYGKIKANPDVKNLYTNRSHLPDYHYYYTGRSGLPDAVIGIDKRYTFNDRLWTQIHDYQDVFEKIYHLNYAPFDNTGFIGGDIIGGSGAKIGIWFSYYHQTVVKTPPNGSVDVYTPYMPDGYYSK